jgi:hypothetical protein
MVTIESIGNSKKANGTSLSGYIKTSYSTLVELFGDSLGPSADNKVAAEWHLLIKDRGEEVGFATIYNYKTGINYDERHGLEVENIRDWHVGSKSTLDFYNVEDYIKEHQHVQ